MGTDDEMTPRVQLGSVPFAVQALTVPDGSITSPKIATGAVTSDKLSIQHGLTIQGALAVDGPVGSSTNVLLRYATDAAGEATIDAYQAVLKPAHYWMACQTGETYWNVDHEFERNPTVGRLSNLYPNCIVVVYYVSAPSGQGKPVSSPPDW